jgi:hypothetical protein
MSEHHIKNILETPLKVVNIGLECFSEALAEQGVALVNLDWIPPGGGDEKLADLLSKLG